MVRGTGLAAASEIGKLGDLAAEAGLHRVAMLAWRDLDDPEAGGSEVHASTIAALWAEAGHRGHDAHLVRGRPGRR